MAGRQNCSFFLWDLAHTLNRQKRIASSKSVVSDDLSPSRVMWEMCIANFATKNGPLIPASVVQVTETQCGLTGTVYQSSRGSIHVRISGAHALRLMCRAGNEGSTVSSIICDRWLIFG